MPKKQSVESFIQDLAQRILHQTKWNERVMVNNSVTLRKRLRDMDNNDRVGFFSPSSGNWLDVDLPNLYSWNIVKPTIRGNKASMMQANVRVDVEPRFTKDSVSEMAAQVSAAIVEQKERLQWTLDLEERIADETQIGAGVFIRTRWNPHIKTFNKVAKWESEEQNEPGEAVCGQCGYEQEVPHDVEPDEMGFGAVQCEQCGADAQVTKFGEAMTVDKMVGYEDFSFGDSETTVHPFWNFRCDNIATEGGNLDAARWFEHHYLVGSDELQLEYPESSDVIQNSNTRWSYACRWQYALQIGDTQPTEYGDNTVDQFREVRDIYLTPAKYLNFEADSDFVLKDGEGKIRFKVAKGKGFKDAIFEGEPFKEPPVLCFRIVSDQILDVYPCDFREEFSYLMFLANPSSFWGLFYTELLSLQDIVNYMLTLQVYHIRRNAITSIVYNKGVFDPDDFEEDLIPTKEEFPYDFPIGQQFGIIPALTLSQEPMQMLQMVIQGKGDVTQVQPAMVGQAQPGETYHAQLLQRQQSLGLLAPAELSKAKAKVRWAKQQLRLKQSRWTDEDTESMLRLNPDWTEDFINAFLKCDFDNDLIIDFIEGSEIPRSLMEREMALRQFMMDVTQMASINPMLLDAQTTNEIMMRLTQAGNIQIDIGNTESTLRLAESRYTKLTELLEAIPPTDPMMSQQVAMQFMSQPPIQLLLRPQLREEHQTEIEFYTDKLNNECAREEPNYLLIACLNIFIQWQEEAEMTLAQQQTMKQMAAQQPMMEMQQQMQSQTMDQQATQQAELAAQTEAQKQEHSQMTQQHQADEAERARVHDMAKHSMTLLQKERERKEAINTKGVNKTGNE